MKISSHNASGEIAVPTIMNELQNAQKNHIECADFAERIADILAGCEPNIVASNGESYNPPFTSLAHDIENATLISHSSTHKINSALNRIVKRFSLEPFLP